MKLKSIFFALIPILFFTACKDGDQVGSSIQPDEDLLRVNSNRIDIESASLLIDSALSKSSYFFLGKYTDNRFGQVQVEFMSQIDSRLGFDGLTIPDTTAAAVAAVATANLKVVDPNYESVTKIRSPRNLRADSVVFVMRFSDDFFGHPETSQAVEIYALNKTLESSTVHKYFTNTDVSGFCKKDTLLGRSNLYRMEDGNEIRIKLKDDFCKRLAKVYQKGSTIRTQAQFNDFFKGVYVSHSFNGDCIVKIEIVGIELYYSYDAILTVTYNGGTEYEIDSATDVKLDDGSPANPVRHSVFLSANKAVERVNLIKHTDLKEKFSGLQDKNKDVTYAYTPAGIYTSVNIPFKTMVDSIKLKASDTTKVMFNSARLTLYAQKDNAKNSDWEIKLNTPNPYMLLIHQDSVVPFFHKNRSPDGFSSFVASYNDTNESYTFDVTKAVQKRLSGQEVSFSENMVAVPIVMEQSDGVNYYRQQLWITATTLYGSKSTDDKKPRLDMIYTQRR